MATIAEPAPRARANAWRLPDIKPSAFPWFRAAWFLLAGAALLATVAGPFLHAREIRDVHKPFADLGLRPQLGSVLQTPHSQALRDQGVIIGSRLTAIEGKPVGEDLDSPAIAAMLRAVPGDRVTLTVRLPDGQVRTLSVRRSAAYIEESYRGSGVSFFGRVAIDLGFAGLTNLLLIATALLLLLRRPRDGLATLLSFSLLLWAAAENLSWYTWWRLGLNVASAPVASIAYTGIILALLLFPDGRFRPAWSKWVALAVVALALHLNNDLVGIDLPPPYYVVPMLLVHAAIVAALVARYRQTPSDSVQKQQERWLALGMAGAAFWLAATFLLQAIPNLFPNDGRAAVWSLMGSGMTYTAVTLSIAIGLLVALLRYRLYDAEAAISRSASLALLTLIFGAVFAGSAKGMELAFEAYLGADLGALPGVLAAVLATIIVTPAQSRVQSWASDRFQKHLVHLRRDLPDCVNDLREVADLPELLDEVLTRVVAGVRASHAAIVIGNRVAAVQGLGRSEAEAWLRSNSALDLIDPCDRSDPHFPMRLRLAVAHNGADEQGWILLGPRPDGSFYGREERDALHQVADPIARAIRIVTKRRSREKRESADRRKVSSALAGLIARIERLEAARGTA